MLEKDYEEMKVLEIERRFNNACVILRENYYIKSKVAILDEKIKNTKTKRHYFFWSIVLGSLLVHYGGILSSVDDVTRILVPQFVFAAWISIEVMGEIYLRDRSRYGELVDVNMIRWNKGGEGLLMGHYVCNIDSEDDWKKARKELKEDIARQIDLEIKRMK